MKKLITILFASLLGTGPYISNRSPDDTTDGIYVYQELAPGYDYDLPISSFPALRGTNDAEKIINLDSDLNTLLDTDLASHGVTQQRIRIDVITVSPTITYRICVYNQPIFGVLCPP
jgi:hypothetical protein